MHISLVRETDCNPVVPDRLVLRLITDEEGFRQVANRTPRRRIAA